MRTWLGDFKTIARGFFGEYILAYWKRYT